MNDRRDKFTIFILENNCGPQKIRAYLTPFGIRAMTKGTAYRERRLTAIDDILRSLRPVRKILSESCYRSPRISPAVLHLRGLSSYLILNQIQ
jgi:hypothetical protein